jgi:hypothetical protein
MVGGCILGYTFHLLKKFILSEVPPNNQTTKQPNTARAGLILGSPHRSPLALEESAEEARR